MFLDHIFFYGTLMRDFPLRRRAGFNTWLQYVGHGRVAGALFDLGPYPALVSGVSAVGGGDHEVCGEVYRMLAPDALLARVDLIEDHRPEAPDAGQYRRLALAAHLDDGRTVDVWAYVYNRSTTSAARIADGDYRHHVQ